MKIWELSVKRPIFMSCILVAMLVVGLFSAKSLPVELFPDVTFPVVTVTTIYPGAGPSEVELLVSKPIEEEIGSIAGVKVVRSINREGVSTVIGEFNMSVDIKFAEQQIRDHVATAKKKLPTDIDEPIIRRIDPAAQPIMILAVKSPLAGGKLFDLANETIRTQLEQVDQVGRVEVVGGRKREVQIRLDRAKMSNRDLSASQVANALRSAGQNIPAGKLDQLGGEVVYRTLGEFRSFDQVKKTVVNFFGNESLTKVEDIGEVIDTVEDEKTRTFLDGKTSIFLNIYKQSGANTIAVSDGIKKKIKRINEDLAMQYGKNYSVELIVDMSRIIQANIEDVFESIGFGVILTIIVVFLFLGSLRSTLITGLAIPVSLIGSMTFMYVAGISINVMSLLAFSLAVGLLIDDAIVVRENIFRHLEMGKNAIQAALDGTAEVGLAVVAVTLAVLAVFAPIAFLSGVVGQFFKSFGLGVCFVMIVSLFDALSNAPMLSAYFGGKHAEKMKEIDWRSPVQSILLIFDRFQEKLEDIYQNILRWALRRPFSTLGITTVILFCLLFSVKFIPKTFLPPQDSGEFSIGLELKPGASLEEMSKISLQVDTMVRKHPEVASTLLTIGNENGQSYISNFYVKLNKFGQRKKTTTQVKAEIRELLKPFAVAQPKVKDVDMVGAGQRPFVINIKGQNLDEVRIVAQKLFSKLKNNPGLLDPEISDKPGVPEFQVKIDQRKAMSYGVNPVIVGQELRAQVEGIVPVKYRENGLEYDVRVRMKEGERELDKLYSILKVPNVNGKLVSLREIAEQGRETGYATINRENRQRYISIEADITPGGPGMGGMISDITKLFDSKEVELPAGITYRFVGQAENFQELGQSILIAGFLAIIFIYLVLASLYESLVTPFTIMTVIPLAIFGGFFGLFVMHASLDLFSMIGCVMLMGLATKNSIILVDYINQKLEEGLSVQDAILVAGKTRLRPILMTSFALIAGMLPVAIGLNEASSQRTSLGIAVIGGVMISTLLTLFVIPTVFTFTEKMRRWGLKNIGNKIVTQSH